MKAEALYQSDAARVLTASWRPSRERPGDDYVRRRPMFKRIAAPP